MTEYFLIAAGAAERAGESVRKQRQQVQQESFDVDTCEDPLHRVGVTSPTTRHRSLYRLLRRTGAPTTRPGVLTTRPAPRSGAAPLTASARTAPAELAPRRDSVEQGDTDTD